MSPNGSVLNTSQAAILNVLARNTGGLTCDQIKARVGEGVAVNAGTIGPVFKNTIENYPDSLHGRGLVRVEKYEDGKSVFRITAAGLRLADKVSFRKRSQSANRIDNDTLDRAVMKVKPTKTYGLEKYTDADIDEVKELLGERWAHVPRTEVRSQMENRRKQGAFADPEKKAAKAARSALRAFGPDGEIQRGLLTPEVVRRLNEIVNAE